MDQVDRDDIIDGIINGINSMVRVFVLFDKSSISGSDDIIINGIYSTVGRKKRGQL
jgi:hypothetical protein